MKKTLKNKIMYSVASGVALASLLSGPSVSVHALPLNKLEYVIKVLKLKDIDSSDELKKELRYLENSEELDDFTSAQKETLKSVLMKETSKKIINDYNEEMKNEINLKISGVLSNLTTGEVEERRLSDGSAIEVGSNDESIDSNSEGDDDENLGGIKLQSVQPGNTQIRTKKYGNRRYTAWVKIKSYKVPIATLKLVNHYSIGNYGLRLNSVDGTGSNGSTDFADVRIIKMTMPDRYAKKAGENINGRGEYHIDGFLNAGYASITSTIKLELLNKTAKTGRVYQTLKFEQ